MDFSHTIYSMNTAQGQGRFAEFMCIKSLKDRKYRKLKEREKIFSPVFGERLKRERHRRSQRSVMSGKREESERTIKSDKVVLDREEKGNKNCKGR